MAKLITKEQMAEQESYIMKLKEENMRWRNAPLIWTNFSI